MVSLGEQSIDLVDTTTLDDLVEVMRPSVLKKFSTAKVRVQFTGANYDRFTGLLGKEYQTPTVKTKFQLMTPDPDGTGTAVGKTLAWDGYVTKVGEISFEKSTTSVSEFDVEIRVNSAIVASNSANEEAP